METNAEASYEFSFPCTVTPERERAEKIPVNARNRTAKLCGVSKDTVSKLVTTWKKARKNSDDDKQTLKTIVLTKANGGNKTSRATQIPLSQDVFIQVHNFVYFQRKSGTRVCSPEVLSFFVRQNILSVKYNNEESYEKRDFEAALKSVRRYLIRKSFKRGKRTGI